MPKLGKNQDPLTGRTTILETQASTKRERGPVQSEEAQSDSIRKIKVPEQHSVPMSPRHSYQVNDLGKIPTPNVQSLNNTRSANVLPPLKPLGGRARNKPQDLEIQFVKQGLHRI